MKKQIYFFNVKNTIQYGTKHSENQNINFILIDSFDEAKRNRDYFRPKKNVNYKESQAPADDKANETVEEDVNTSRLSNVVNSSHDESAETFFDSSDSYISYISQNEGGETPNSCNVSETGEGASANAGDLTQNEMIGTFNDAENSGVNLPENNQTNLIDTKVPLDAVQVNEIEMSVFNTIFDNDSGNYELKDGERIIISPGGTKKVTKKIDEDCEILFDLAEFQNAFTPQQAGYQVKVNDSLSQNMPFKENVSQLIFVCFQNKIFIGCFCFIQASKDRAYLIQIDGASHEVILAARVVDGLLFLNENGRREDVSKDKVFLKALLISVFSLSAIRALQPNQNLPRELLNFIKG